jgi:hypothetical protein
MRQRSGYLWFEASPGKKLVRPYLNQQVEHGVHAYDPSYTGGQLLAKNVRPYLKNNLKRQHWVEVV